MPVMEDMPVEGTYRREWLVMPLFCALSLICTGPILTHIDYWGPQDWDQHLVYNAVPVRTLLEFHQLPLWNPYMCGGLPMLANPQSRCLSPTVLLQLVFGTVVGIKLEIVLFYVIGCMGMYCLSRRYRLEPLPAVLAATVYMFCSMHVLQLTTGMTWALSVQYVPWVLLAYEKSFANLRCAPVSGLLLALIFFSGGHYILPLTVLTLLLVSLLALRSHGLVNTLKVFGVIILFALGIGAVKIIPALELVHRFPRHTHDASGFSLEVFGDMLVRRDQVLETQYDYVQSEEFTRGILLGMDENGMYIGWLSVALFALGLLGRGRRRWQWAVCLMVLVWLSFGARIPISLWNLLHALPVFSFMYATQRFRLMFMLFVALFAGSGLTVLGAWLLRRGLSLRWVKVATVGLVAGVAVDLLWVSCSLFKKMFVIPPSVVMEQVPSRAEPFKQIIRWQPYDRTGLIARETTLYASSSCVYPAFLRNYGTLGAYEYIPVERHATPSEAMAYRGEIYLQDERNRATCRSWSPNRLKVEVDVRQPDYLIVNQNYDPGWKVRGAASGVVEAINGRIGVRVKPGDDIVELYYLPTSFLVGSTITILTVLLWGLVFGFLVKKKSPAVDGGADKGGG
jgi:hypothetical protein